MTKQLVFLVVTIITLGAFSFTIFRLYKYLNLTQSGFKIDRIRERIKITFQVAFGQTKILRRPVIGLMHALVFWGFLVITIGTLEMIIDGLIGSERVLSQTGGFYKFVTASGDIFAALIIISCIIFLLRRHVFHIKRFSGIEMTRKSELDASLALTMILLLMVSLVGLNISYVSLNPDSYKGSFPVSELLIGFTADYSNGGLVILQEVSWWTHILLVYIFANVLPYSKHFHVFMAVPNVFLTRLQPLTKIENMEEVTKEVKLMMNPDSTPSDEEAQVPKRFGVKDVEDASWLNYVDSLTCTECGRCTSVCPANITGKQLSPRKIFVDFRKRMKEKGPGMVKEGTGFSDNKSLVGDYITAEELWACTTCNACAQECPVNIDHPSLIIDMRRYLVLEESAAPNQLNVMFSNIENNGAPWPFPQSERMKWSDRITL